MICSSLRVSALSVAVLLMASFSASAERMSCKVEGDVLGPQRLTWDTNTGAAEIDLESGARHGVVTRVEPRENGQKVNFIFKGVDSEAETEFMIVPGAVGYVLVGVGYNYADGKKYLATSHGHFQAKCAADSPA